MSALDRMFGLAGKTVVLTGGGGVIAGALAEGFLQAGAKVALWGPRVQSLDEARARLAASAGGAGDLVSVIADAADERAVTAAVARTVEACGGLDVLVNCAGGNRGKAPFLQADVAQFEEVLRLNLVAGLLVPTKVVCGHWVAHGVKGSVINLASMGSYVPLSGVWAYNAAKAGVVNLTMAAAKEFAPKGIRVNAVAPGFFLGKQNRALLVDEKTGEFTPRGRDVIARTPMGRFGDARELVGAALFLASGEASGFVTGVCIPVDGGFLVDCI